MNAKIVVMATLLGVGSAGLALHDAAAEASTKAPTTEKNTEHMDAQLKGYVLPSFVGIKTGEMSATALHELSTTDRIERRDARQLVDLAEHAIRMSHRQAQRLFDMESLSIEARADAKVAEAKLKEAHASASRIKRDVGKVQGLFASADAAKIREQAMKLHGELLDAEASLQKVADAYKISTRLDGVGESSPLRSAR